MKRLIIDSKTKETRIEDIEENHVEETPTNIEPTIEERLAATEEALLALMEMGMMG